MKALDLGEKLQATDEGSKIWKQVDSYNKLLESNKDKLDDLPVRKKLDKALEKVEKTIQQAQEALKEKENMEEELKELWVLWKSVEGFRKDIKKSLSDLEEEVKEKKKPPTTKNEKEKSESDPTTSPASETWDEETSIDPALKEWESETPPQTHPESLWVWWNLQKTRNDIWSWTDEWVKIADQAADQIEINKWWVPGWILGWRWDHSPVAKVMDSIWDLIMAEWWFHTLKKDTDSRIDKSFGFIPETLKKRFG